MNLLTRFLSPNFRFSISHCKVILCLLHVYPIPKKSDPSIIYNYRPISLLYSENTLFERLIFKHLFNHFQGNNLLSLIQSGSIPGDYCSNQLTFFYNTFYKAIDAGKVVRAVFYDIINAFDRVWYAVLIHKLKAAGLTGKVFTWLKSYFSNRRQRVVLLGTTSDWVCMIASVQKGSNLGPILFLSYINDMLKYSSFC